MQLPSGMADKLSAVGDAITSQTIKFFVLKLLLGLLFFAISWPYVVELSFLARDGLARLKHAARQPSRLLRGIRKRFFYFLAVFCIYRSLSALRASEKLDNALGEFTITVGTQAGVVKVLLGMVSLIGLWPYLVKLPHFLRHALAPMMTAAQERPVAMRELQERQRTQLVEEGNRNHHHSRFFSSSDGQITTKTQVLLLPPPPPPPPPPQQQQQQQQQQQDYAWEKSQAAEIAPITTLQRLLDYEGPSWGRGFAPVRRGGKPFVPPPFPALKNRLLVCHDLAGGYGEDRLVQGGGYDRAYRMYDWGLIDVFVYFSHKLVTIPPAGWIDVAHRHGTRVLGTFITEWEEGSHVCGELLRSEQSAERAATKLTRLAMDYGFDGWLINIENKVESTDGQVEHLAHFVKSLTCQMRAAKERCLRDTLEWSGLPTGSHLRGSGEGQICGHANDDECAPEPNASRTLVLWYDSVTKDGELAWQDQLNSNNRLFFDACDGIFTNYCWKADCPYLSAFEAQARRFDVYMGIDTFGRGTWGGGGFDVDKALKNIRRAGVSAALFAPAWTMEDKTSGGGRVSVDPDTGVPGDWKAVETAFSGVDAKFWGKVAAAWHAPRRIPGFGDGGGWGGGPQGSGGMMCWPVVVNFGDGVGDRWRVEGNEVASFGDGGTASAGGLIGGAFYDLASQCVTPMVGGRGCGGEGKAGDVVVRARRAGDPHGDSGDVNGLVGAKHSFEDGYDGASSLCFTGVLDRKASAKFPLYRCDIPLPPEPLEVRIAFHGNEDSELALVLSLDVPHGTGERREIVLRGWGKEGISSERPVFSKRVALSESRAVYSPVQEACSGGANSGNHGGAFVEEELRALRALRATGESFDSIGNSLRATRRKSNDDQDDKNHDNAPAASPVPTWITRKYVVRDLRVGGGRAITDIHVVCAVRKSEGSSPEISDFGSGSRDRGDGSPSTRLGGTLRLRAGGGDRFERGGGDNARDVPRLAAFRAFLGEIAIGPWRKGTPEAFGIIEGLRATEVAFSEGSGDDMGADDGDVTVDLSLEWEIETNGGSERYVDAATRMTRHCDLWRLCSNEPGGVEEWQWLGRAYGRKYRLRGLRLGRGRQGWDEGSAEETEEDASLSLAVQQVNGMGYRQPVKKWARLQLRMP